MTLRLRLDFAYDGTDFHGWAAQPGLRTVEGELTAGLATILRADPPPRLTVAGRTDAGVHGRGAVAHVDVDWGAWDALPGRSARPPREAALTRLFAEGKPISADAVKALVTTPARTEIPVLVASPVDLLAYAALLTDRMHSAEVGT